jgi:hypothetical protein
MLHGSCGGGARRRDEIAWSRRQRRSERCATTANEFVRRMDSEGPVRVGLSFADVRLTTGV